MHRPDVKRNARLNVSELDDGHSCMGNDLRVKKRRRRSKGAGGRRERVKECGEGHT